MSYTMQFCIAAKGKQAMITEKQSTGPIDLDALKTEWRMTYDKGDSWGCVMAWLFAIADEMHWQRDLEVPAKWEYSPGMGIGDTESYQYQACHAATDEALTALGEMLWRFRDLCIRKGLDY